MASLLSAQTARHSATPRNPNEAFKTSVERATTEGVWLGELERAAERGAGDEEVVSLVLSSAGARRVKPGAASQPTREMMAAKKVLVVQAPVAVVRASPYLAGLLEEHQVKPQPQQAQAQAQAQPQAQAPEQQPAETPVGQQEGEGAGDNGARPKDDEGARRGKALPRRKRLPFPLGATANHARSAWPTILLTFSKASAVSSEAVVFCLEWLAAGSDKAVPIRIDHHNQFQMLAAANLLRVRAVVEVCIDFVAANLTTSSVVAAAKFAMHLNSARLLEACYFHAKGHLIHLSAAASSSMLKIDVLGGGKRSRASWRSRVGLGGTAQPPPSKSGGGGVGGGGGGVGSGDDDHAAPDAALGLPELVFSEDGMMRFGNSSITVGVFRDNARQELGAKVGYNKADFVYDLYYVDEATVGADAYPRTYKMYHDNDNAFVMMAYQADEFSEFLISTDENFVVDRSNSAHSYGPSFLGCVRSNFLGTEFSCFDFGVDPAHLPPVPTPAQQPFPVRRELCHIVFDRNVMGSQPRALKIRLPARLPAAMEPAPQAPPVVVDEGGGSEGNNKGDDKGNDKGGEGEDEGKEKDFVIDLNDGGSAQKGTGGGSAGAAGGGGGAGAGGGAGGVPADDLDPDNCIEFVNKPPFWNEEHECWMLDFFGRVKLASAKNFQVVQGEDGQEVFLMFGKMTETRYALDFRHPISRVQAFGIGLAGIARKLAVN